MVSAGRAIGSLIAYSINTAAFFVGGYMALKFGSLARQYGAEMARLEAHEREVAMVERLNVKIREMRNEK